MSGIPDGIDQTHVQGKGLMHRHASPISFLLLGALLLLACIGFLGGRPSPALIRDTDAARLEVRTPTIARNGMLFETRIRITPHRPLDNLVIAISSSLWRDLTINSMFPAASDEDGRDGFFRFSYGRREAGQALAIKIDGQINPPLFAGNRGSIAIFDGDTELARLPVHMQVRP